MRNNAMARAESKRVDALLALLFARRLTTSLGPLTPPANGSWSQSAWFIDPANVSGHASDSNNGTSRTTPLLTYRRLTELWGTVSPILTPSTGNKCVITWMSSQADNTDPVICYAYLAKGKFLEMTGDLTQVATGTTSGVVAKNRNTPQLLEANLGASANSLQLVQINVGAGQLVRFWTYLRVSGNVWSLSQPLDLYTPDTGALPTSNDTVANGQPFTLFQPVEVNVCVWDCLPIEFDTLAQNIGWITNLTVTDFADESSDVQIGPYSGLVDTLLTREVIASSSSTDVSIYFVNCNVGAGAGIETSVWVTNLAYWGGIAGSSGGFDVVGTYFSNDCILPTRTTLRQGTIDGGVYIETGATLATGGLVVLGPQDAAGPFIWGPGNLDVLDTGSIRYPPGDAQAVACFLLKGSMHINGQATAFSATVATPSVVNGGISITPANLDAVAGAAGFGGVAFLPGGGSITNYGL